MKDNIPNCKGKDCQDPEGYLPERIRCNLVSFTCGTCGATVTFPPLEFDDDYERGDHFVRDLKVQHWMCPKCSAVWMGKKKKQTTLDGLFG